MADKITAKNDGAKFKPHPEGQFIAVCVDTIAMGDKVEQFPGKPERLVPKCTLVFRTGERNDETGEVTDVSREFTISMGEKANLRKFLEDWRGKSYSEDEADAGVPIDRLVGNPALITVEHRKSGAGKTYANIKGITMLPKQMRDSAPDTKDYKRPDYFEERKKAYAEEVKKYMDSVRPAGAGKDRVRLEESGGTGLPEDWPQQEPEDDTSDLPF